MAAIVISCGRTGTNIVLDSLRVSPKLNATFNIHDENSVKVGKKVDSNYFSKADTDAISKKQLITFIEKNKHIKIIGTIRHPYDIILSKIYRGQPNTEGRGNWNSWDSSPKNCIHSIKNAYCIHQYLLNTYPSQFRIIKMENLILQTENELQKLCKFLNIPYIDSMKNFPKRMRNKHKKKRYKKIDKLQINLWKRYTEIYSGFFNNYNVNLEDLFKKVTLIAKEYGYETID